MKIYDIMFGGPVELKSVIMSLTFCLLINLYAIAAYISTSGTTFLVGIVVMNLVFILYGVSCLSVLSYGTKIS